MECSSTLSDTNRFVQTLGESDTDSIVGMSEQGDGAEVMDATPAEVLVAFIPRATQYSDAFASLDGVCLRMYSIPGRLSCSQFLSSSEEVHSEVPSECLQRARDTSAQKCYGLD